MRVLVATCLVAVLPPVLALALRAYGVISSPWLSMALAIAMSLIVSSAGSVYWRKRQNGGDAVFSELLLWGWIRRRLQDRQLSNAIELLDLADTRSASDPSLSFERRERLLRQLAEAIEGRDIYLGGHSRRVARHAVMIARGLGLPAEDVARIRAAAAIHDVGKLRTPKPILNKRGRLTDAEFEVIKRHPVDGADLVAALGDPALTRIVRHHHERLDGCGYPDGLAGDAIPLGSRIIAVADTFDAITSARPYRAASPHQRAIDVLRTEAGSQLDPGAVRAFLDYYSGRRPTVAFALAIAALRRVVSWLSGDPAAAATVSASKVAAATAATAVIAVSAGAPVAAFRPAATHHGAAKPSAHAVLAAVRSEALSAPPVARLLPAPPPASARAAASRRSPARRPKAHSHAGVGRPAIRRARPASPPVRAARHSRAAARPAVMRPAPLAPPPSRAAKAQPPAHHPAPHVSKPKPTVRPSPPATSTTSAVGQVGAPASGGAIQGSQGEQGSQGSQDSQGGDNGQGSQGAGDTQTGGQSGDVQGNGDQADGGHSQSRHDGTGDGGASHDSAVTRAG